MPRIDIELTSSRPDGSWTWRAAGARQPKGVLDGTLLYAGAKVGDVARADSEMGLDGIHVTAVVAPKERRADPDRLEFIGTGRTDGGVTGDGVAAARRGERPRSTRPGRERSGPARADDRGDRRGPRRDPRSGPGGAPGAGDRSRPGRPERDSPDRRPRGDGPRDRPRSAGRGAGTPAEAGAPGPASRAARPRRDDRPPRPERARPERARPKRLQAGRAHRDAALAALPPEQRPVAEHVLRGGMPAVRQALADQNARARAAGEPEVRADALIEMAESLVPRMRAAEWRDKAEAAAGAIEEVGLRDLRAIVVGSDAAGRDDESRALVATLREGLDRRNAAARDEWLGEIRQSVSDGRLVRALRVSARPPEPGCRLPEDLAKDMTEAAGAALAADATTDRWLAVLEAAVSSPVRAVVRPAGLPREPTAQFHKAVMLAAPRMPGLRELMGPAAASPATIGSPPAPPAPPRPATSPASSPSNDAEVEVGAEAAGQVVDAEPPSEPASGDGGDDPVLVEELG